MTINQHGSRPVIAWLITAAIFVIPLPLLAQGTNINAPDNKYSIGDDIKLPMVNNALPQVHISEQLLTDFI